MRIGFGILGIALAATACGARVDDSHTGGKTSWLSACSEDSDCSDLNDAVCASRVCTTECQNDCSIRGTSCVNLWTNGNQRDEGQRACLPECDNQSDCATYGSNYTCEANVCVVDNTSVTRSDELPDTPLETDTSDAGVDARDTFPYVVPTRDLSGIVLLDNFDDGNNTPLEDLESPAGFNQYGFWYTYDDFQVCMDNENPNPDTSTVLTPAQGQMLTTTAYSTLGLQPPAETLVTAPNNTHGIRFTGTSHEYFGAGLGFKFEGAYANGYPGINLQAAGYTGIRFWVYSPQAMDVVVKLEDAYSTPEAGLCEPRGPYPECKGTENCGNAPSTDIAGNIVVGPAWQLYELYFASVSDDPTTQAIERGPFLRANWSGDDIDGNPMSEIPPTPNRIYQLKFQTAVAEGDGTFDVIFDNVGFIEANGPEDNAQGAFAPE